MGRMFDRSPSGRIAELEEELAEARGLLGEAYRRYDMDACGCGDCLACRIEDVTGSEI